MTRLLWRFRWYRRHVILARLAAVPSRPRIVYALPLADYSARLQRRTSAASATLVAARLENRT